jgi:hypothetical protein
MAGVAKHCKSISIEEWLANGNAGSFAAGKKHVFLQSNSGMIQYFWLQPPKTGAYVAISSSHCPSKWTKMGEMCVDIEKCCFSIFTLW